VLVPVVYEFVDDFETWLKPKLAPLVTPKDGPVLEPLTQDRGRAPVKPMVAE